MGIFSRVFGGGTQSAVDIVDQVAPRRVTSTEDALALTVKALDGPAQDVPPTPAKMPANMGAMLAADSFQNFATALGTVRDKRTAGGFNVICRLSRQQLDALYTSSWVAARIVDAPAEDAFREGYSPSWADMDDDNKDVKTITAAEDALHVRAKVLDAYRWARLYGGAGLVVGIKGQKDWSAPLDPATVKKGDLELLHVLDRWRLSASGEIDRDRTSPNFGHTLYYSIAEAADSVALIHWTRVILFHGKRLPYFEWTRNARWHDSVLQHIYDSIRDYEAIRGGIASMVDEADVDILSVKNLGRMLSTPGGKQALIDRIMTGAMLKSVNHVWVIDGGPDNVPNAASTETYQQKTTSFSGVNEVFSSVSVPDVCGAAEIPATRMFGKSPDGMNSTGDSDQKNYETRIGREQNSEIRPPLMRLYEIVVRHALGFMPEDFGIEFKPLSSMSATEKADTELKRAQRDKYYYDMGAVTEGVIARELEHDGIYLTLETDDVSMAEELSDASHELALNPPAPIAPAGKAPATKAAPAKPAK